MCWHILWNIPPCVSTWIVMIFVVSCYSFLMIMHSVFWRLFHLHSLEIKCSVDEKWIYINAQKCLDFVLFFAFGENYGLLEYGHTFILKVCNTHVVRCRSGVCKRVHIPMSTRQGLKGARQWVTKTRSVVFAYSFLLSHSSINQN